MVMIKKNIIEANIFYGQIEYMLSINLQEEPVDQYFLLTIFDYVGESRLVRNLGIFADILG